MLGYISSTRKKSCKQCVKAKRRCDLGFPCCKRCFSRSLDCAYPNGTVRQAEVIIRQATPDLSPPTSSNQAIEPIIVGPAIEVPPPTRASTNTSPSPTFAQRSTPPSPDNYEDFNSYGFGGFNMGYATPATSPEIGMRHVVPRISSGRELDPVYMAPQHLNDETVMYLVGKLCSFVPTLASTGHNIFIHSKLYEIQQPTAYEDSCAISALYLNRTKKTIPILVKAIDNKINALILSSTAWSLTDHLAAVQALIIYQTIRLFDPSLKQQAQADIQNRLLEIWTAHLWKRSFNESASFKSGWDAWVFYESLRRTVLMSVFLRGGWSCFTREGLCDQIPVLSRLPLAKDDRLWDIEDTEAEEKCSMRPDANLVAYGDWSYAWIPLVQDPKQLTDFQRMLLGACRGKEDPRLLR